MDSSISISLEQLTIGYYHGRTEIAVSDGLMASLRYGQLTCLLGPNGSGKSTLLRTLCGFQPALGGQVVIRGKQLPEYTPVELAKLIAVVLTERTDVANMSVEQLVSAGRSPYTGFWGKLSLEDHTAVREALKAVGALSLSNRPVITLSDGERQKVMIAKAIAQQTPIIVLDEPTAFLDYPSKVEIMQFLNKLAHEHDKTIFMSTHDLEISIPLSDNLWLLDREKGLTTGTPAQLAGDGSIGRYFERPGLTFNPSTLHFTVTPLSNLRSKPCKRTSGGTKFN